MLLAHQSSCQNMLRVKTMRLSLARCIVPPLETVLGRAMAADRPPKEGVKKIPPVEPHRATQQTGVSRSTITEMIASGVAAPKHQPADF